MAAACRAAEVVNRPPVGEQRRRRRVARARERAGGGGVRAAARWNCLLACLVEVEDKEA